MRIKIVGQTALLKFLSHLGKYHDGYCEPPGTPNRAIKIRKTLTGKKELEVVHHELTHLADWSKDEEWVTEFSCDMANILWRLGYRRLPKDKLKEFDENQPS
jgi:hypothetical protein